MSPNRETLAWLRLGLITELTPTGFRKLLAALSTPESICAADRATLARVVSADVAAAIARGPDLERLDAARRWLEDPANRLVTFADDAYPRLLLEITDPPPLLYVKGGPALLNRPSLARRPRSRTGVEPK